MQDRQETKEYYRLFRVPVQTNQDSFLVQTRDILLRDGINEKVRKWGKICKTPALSSLAFKLLPFHLSPYTRICRAR